MTLHTKAKAFHYKRLKERNVKRYPFERNFQVVICDVMMSYYRLCYRSSWREIATDLLNCYKDFSGEFGGILFLVADLYKTPNEFRKLVATTRLDTEIKKVANKASKIAKRDEDFDDIGCENEDVRIKIEPPDVGDDFSSPPNKHKFSDYLHNSAWKTQVILPKIGEELRKMRLNKTVLILRGFCLEPEEITNPKLFDRRKSYGMLWVCPSQRDTRECSFACDFFDDISCPSTAEADLSTVSLAAALTKHHATLLPKLSSEVVFDDKFNPPSILMLGGDGDAHTINMFMAFMRKYNNIYIAVLDVDGTIPFFYNAMEAARKVPDKDICGKKTALFTYCCMMYLCGCDYTEKMYSVNPETLSESLVEKVIHSSSSTRISNNIYSGGQSPLTKFSSSMSSEMRPEHLVFINEKNGDVSINHIAWCSLIMFSLGALLKSCNCDTTLPSECHEIYRKKSKVTEQKSTKDRITLHYIMTILAGLESTLRYFTTEWDEDVDESVTTVLSDTCGYYKDHTGVHFGMIPVSEDNPHSLEYFLGMNTEFI